MAFDHLIDETQLQTKRTVRTRFRQSIFEAWGHRCAYCGGRAESLNHVLPKARGGLTVIQNLAPACCRCNGAKSDHEWIGWFRQQAWHTVEREAALARWLGLPEQA